VSAPLLELEHVVKVYPLARGGGAPLRRRATTRALDDVSLAVFEGEALGLVGETGCGKSTLARVALALAPPTSGTIRYRGADVTRARGARAKALARERQLVFQDPAGSLNPRRTVGASVAEPYAIHGLLPDRRLRRRRVEELLEQVRLDPRHHDRYPHELSGGQRQRVGIARAIALGPRLLVADEPVSALDVSIQAQILNLLERLRRELGLTLLLISHDLAVVRHACERVAVMRAGRIVELAGVEQLFAAPQDPYTRELLAAIPRLPLAAARGTGAPAAAAQRSSSSSSSSSSST
jgi:ABC-type oligopeptide transport system ATPase subunit